MIYPPHVHTGSVSGGKGIIAEKAGAGEARPMLNGVTAG